MGTEAALAVVLDVRVADAVTERDLLRARLERMKALYPHHFLTDDDVRASSGILLMDAIEGFDPMHMVFDGRTTEGHYRWTPATRVTANAFDIAIADGAIPWAWDAWFKSLKDEGHEGDEVVALDTPEYEVRFNYFGVPVLVGSEEQMRRWGVRRGERCDPEDNLHNCECLVCDPEETFRDRLDYTLGRRRRWVCAV